MTLDVSPLAAYGPLGLWTMVLLYDKYSTLCSMKKTVEANTIATNRLSSLIEYFKRGDYK